MLLPCLNVELHLEGLRWIVDRKGLDKSVGGEFLFLLIVMFQNGSRVVAQQALMLLGWAATAAPCSPLLRQTWVLVVNG